MQQLDHFERHVGLQDTAKMLVTSGASMDRHHDAVEVTDYLGNEAQTRKIKLDNSITLRENVSRMFKKYKKAERGKSLVQRQLKETSTLRHTIEKEEQQVRSIKDWDSWFALTGTAKGQRTERPMSETLSKTSRKPRRVIQIEGRK